MDTQGLCECSSLAWWSSRKKLVFQVESKGNIFIIHTTSIRIMRWISNYLNFTFRKCTNRDHDCHDHKQTYRGWKNNRVIIERFIDISDKHVYCYSSTSERKLHDSVEHTNAKHSLYVFICTRLPFSTTWICLFKTLQLTHRKSRFSVFSVFFVFFFSSHNTSDYLVVAERNQSYLISQVNAYRNTSPGNSMVNLSGRNFKRDFIALSRATAVAKSLWSEMDGDRKVSKICRGRWAVRSHVDSDKS